MFTHGKTSELQTSLVLEPAASKIYVLSLVDIESFVLLNLLDPDLFLLMVRTLIS